MKLKSALLILLIVVAASCGNKKNKFDASGAFEAEETIFSSEAAGVLKQFNVAEGQTLHAGQVIGYIDSTQLVLKKKQLEAQIKSVLAQRPDIQTQLASLQEQLKAAQVDQQRINNLVKQDALPRKQLDDVNAKVDVLKKQIDAQQSQLKITSGSISEQANPLQVQIQQVNDQLSKCTLINPVNGTVLTKYAEPNEVVAPGKPLYKIADMSTLLLRAYITGGQLSQVKLNQKVKVLIDDGPEKYRELGGAIEWISSQAEFTPKTIQTKEERANLVYATKIRVKNDGSLKIGMYGEVKF
jgi:HlyD family secretion protein